MQNHASKNRHKIFVTLFVMIFLFFDEIIIIDYDLDIRNKCHVKHLQIKKQVFQIT